MPVGYTVLQDKALVVERWFGSILHEDLITNREELLIDASMPTQVRVFADARFAVFEEATFEFSMRMKNINQRIDNRNEIVSYALLVSEKDWPKAKAFEAQILKNGDTVITFITMESACSWLNIDTYDVLNCLSRITLYPKYHKISSSLFLFDSVQ